MLFAVIAFSIESQTECNKIYLTAVNTAYNIYLIGPRRYLCQSQMEICSNFDLFVGWLVC